VRARSEPRGSGGAAARVARPASHAAPQRQQLASWRAIGAWQVRQSRGWCRSRMTIISCRCESASACRGSTARFRARQRYGLGRRTAAVVDPPLAVEPCLRLTRPAFVEVAEAIDDRRARPRPAALSGALVTRHRAKADELSEIARALERGSAARAQLVEAMVRAIAMVEADLAGHALEMGHQGPFRSGTRPSIPAP
jgi:hypothetical protein